MAEPCCTAIKTNGEPCAARPLPDSPFCLFHDPARQEALAESRSKGGATPRRRTRRFPRILDYKHVAELLGELFVDALNDPAACDPVRLRALTGLSNVLLKAVGRPDDTYWYNRDRTEPAATDAHLLRIYPSDPPERARLLDAEAALEADLAAPNPPSLPYPADPSDPSNPSDPPRVPEHPKTPTPDTQHPTPLPDDALSAEPERFFRTPPEDSAACYSAPNSVLPAPGCDRPNPEPEQPWPPYSELDDGQGRNRSGIDAPAGEPSLPDEIGSTTFPNCSPSASPIGYPRSGWWGSLPVDPGFSPGSAEQDEEQGMNRSATGTPDAVPFLPIGPVRAPFEDGPRNDPIADHSAGSPPPAASIPPPLPLGVESPASTTLSVPGIPILISIRPVPGPFG